MSHDGLGQQGVGPENAGAELPGSAPAPGPFPQYGQYAQIPEINPNPSSGNGETQPSRPMTREQAQRMRQMEHEGVSMWMDRTGLEATVKALSFADRTMLGGIDPHLQAEITAGFNARGANRGVSGNKNITFGDLLRGVGNEERLANAICCAGFISPRLTLTKSEADLANDPNVWFVEDLHVLDRRKYCNFVLGMDDEEAKRITDLLHDRVSGTGDISVMRTAPASLGIAVHGGSRVLRKFRLAFDRSCLTFVQRYRRMRDKTKQEPLPPDERRRKPKPTRTVPFHTEEELLEFLGVNVQDESDVVSEILGELDAAMWDTVEWDDEEDE